MSDLHSLGAVRFTHVPSPAAMQEWVIRLEPLRRILRFTGRSIDDVVNSPVAKNEVFGYFKLQKNIARRTEIVELEQQWNAVG